MKTILLCGEAHLLRTAGFTILTILLEFGETRAGSHFTDLRFCRFIRNLFPQIMMDHRFIIPILPVYSECGRSPRDYLAPRFSLKYVPNRGNGDGVGHHQYLYRTSLSREPGGRVSVGWGKRRRLDAEGCQRDPYAGYRFYPPPSP